MSAVAVARHAPNGTASRRATTSRAESNRDPELVSVSARLMGGQVSIHVRPSDVAGFAAAGRDADMALRRIGAWADRLTRFTTTSDLARLNADPRPAVPVRPTLGAVLDWCRSAEALTDGIVDIALLDARLTAEGLLDVETGGTGTASAASRSWSLDRGSLGGVVCRPVGLRFDLDGVAKGWLADRALGLLDRHPTAVVDADGDVAIRLGTGKRFQIGVADPRHAALDLAVLELAGPHGPGNARFGLATSGTSVHRWIRAGQVAHHLIDPRTGRPARTDVVQATVLARTARAAEALAKAAVILGSTAALAALDRPRVDGAILLTEGNEILMLPSTLRWLA